MSKIEMPTADPVTDEQPFAKDPAVKLAERYGSNAWRGLADSGHGEGNENQVLLKATVLNASLAASRRGDHATCEWYCSRALAEDRMCVKGWFRRGRARVAMSRWDEAEDDHNRAERLQGDYAIAKELEVERKKLAAGRKKSESGGAVAKAFRAVFGGGGGGAGEYPPPKEIRTLVCPEVTLRPGPQHPTGDLRDDLKDAEPEPGAQLDELVDDTSMNARIEHAYNKALEFEQRGLNDFVDSGAFLFISVRAIRLTTCFDSNCVFCLQACPWSCTQTPSSRPTAKVTPPPAPSRNGSTWYRSARRRASRSTRRSRHRNTGRNCTTRCSTRLREETGCKGEPQR